MENDNALKPGTILLHGTYRIERNLGQGGFGITYLATDLNLQRYVCIKEFYPKDFCGRDDTSHVTSGRNNDTEFINRLKLKFLKEARNIAKFDHPNIIRIYAAFEENETAYYVMDYIEGESLSDLVKREGALSEGRAMEYIEKVGRALDYVHGRKINHLDVKPANIMIRKSDNTPILIDFGLSKQYDKDNHQTSTTLTGVSHGYAPNEQYLNGGVKEFSPQTDIYSLAATLYYILSGVVPPQAQILVDEDLTFPANIPPKFFGPISTAMSPKRHHRQSNVVKFLQDLKSAGNGGANNGNNGGAANKKAVSDADGETTFPKQKATSNASANASPEPHTIYTNPPVSSSSSNNRETESSEGYNWKLIVGVAVAVVCVIMFFVLGRGKTSDSAVEDTPITVVAMDWDSPLGAAKYTGEVRADTLINGEVKIIPHGKGVAKIVKGKYEGDTYDGNFINGIMEGETKYTLVNGDVFTGSFHDNQYYSGRYTDNKTGEYYEGSFKKMAPEKGAWYDANGNFLEEVK